MAKPIPVSDLEACIKEPPEDTRGFYFHHVNYRIKDPRVTLKFYNEMLGMRLVHSIDIPSQETSLYFVGYADDIPEDADKIMEYVLAHRQGLIEFMYHWGSDQHPDVQYVSGNERNGKGYSHICIRVPDPYTACQKLQKQGVRFVKETDKGLVHGLCYFLDPDGYWVELIGPNVTFSEEQDPPLLQEALRPDTGT